jgi:hypothetical protein
MLKERGEANELNGFEIAVCENQAALFRDCQWDFAVDAFDFIEKFMTSSIAESMDKDISVFHNNGTKQIGEAVLRECAVKAHDGDYYNPDVLFWAGYIYRYWCWWLGESSRDIYRFADISRMAEAYGLHVLSPERAIQKLKESGRHEPK